MFYELTICNLLIRGVLFMFKHICRKMLTFAYNLGCVRKVLSFCYNYNTVKGAHGDAVG
jgi:hypothetical protein